MSAVPEPIQAPIFRAATANDWPQIAKWIANTWDWGDYINAYVWMDWAAAKPDAQLIVGEQDGRIVCFARLMKLGEAEWWLEGVRVAPELRGQGMGKALISHMIELYRQSGQGILRFFTGSKNDAMRSVARDLGFVHRLSYAQMTAPAAEVDYTNFKVLTANNHKMVWQYLRPSPMYRANHFVERDWTAYYLTSDRLQELLADPTIDVLGWRNMNQLAGIAIVVPYKPDKNEGTPMYIGYIDAPDDTTLQQMLDALRGVAIRKGFDRVWWRMPLAVGLERPLERTEYTRQWEGALWLFELPLRTLNAMDSVTS